MTSVCAISVVVPCFNAARTVPAAFASVLRQTARPAQVVLVDDGSADDTPRLLDEWRAEHGGWVEAVHLEKNRGPAAARNAGWSRAREPLVAFLDADDAWHPQKLELQFDWMTRHADVTLGFHSHAPALSERRFDAAELRARPLSFRRLLFANTIRMSTAMLRSEHCADCRFDERLRFSEDYRLWLGLLARGARAVGIDAPLAAIPRAQWLGRGQSADVWAMERAELSNFAELQRRGRLGPAWRTAASAWSLVKFARRALVRATSAAKSGKI